ncbi:hypothetical protein ACFOZY_00135 [Chungangia koreensis]|uniref:Uncharacterized protein n=1 Tax=Chungangia koreensis TaxID=752657 RepID=A0ABV8WZY4_9LACT
MIRKGRFGKWKNKEYELFFYQGKYFLRTNDIQDKDLGFTPIEEGKGQLVKETAIRDLEDAYEIVPYAMVEGHRLNVEGFDFETKIVALTSNNPYAKEKLGMRPYGRHEYIIELPFDRVQLEEEKVSLFDAIIRTGH